MAACLRTLSAPTNERSLGGAARQRFRGLGLKGARPAHKSGVAPLESSHV